MARKSIGSLHAEVTANAQGFINEFKRADNQARMSSTAIDKEVDKLTKGVKRKFELADVGKDILKGAGLFGGFQIAQTAADAIVDNYREAADFAKRIEESSARQLANTLEMIRGRRSAEEQIAFLSRDIARNQERIDAMKDPAGRTFTVPTGDGGDYTLVNELRPEQQEAVAALTEEIQRLTAARKALSDTLVSAADKERAAAAGTALTDFFGDLDAQSALMAEYAKATSDVGDAEDATTRAVAARAEAQALANQRFEEAAALTLAVRTPLEKYTAEIERLNEMEARGSITTETAARAIGDAAEAYAKASGEVEDYASRLAEAGKQQDVVGQKATAWSSGMAAMWENVADRAGQSFADILINGENTFSSLVDIISRSVIEMAARLAIINPLINGLFGLSGAAAMPAFFGAGAKIPGRAMGGGVEAGVTYRVNEAGEEFFKSNTGGTIIPAGISAGMNERGGGDSYAFNYSFATGITKAELGPLLALNQRQTLAQLADIRRRGGATARAY